LPARSIASSSVTSRNAAMTSRSICWPLAKPKPSPCPGPTGCRRQAPPAIAPHSSKATRFTPIVSSTPTIARASSACAVVARAPRSPTLGSRSIQPVGSPSPSSVPCATVAPSSRSRRSISSAAWQP
jgi:hypothetical protein